MKKVFEKNIVQFQKIYKKKSKITDIFPFNMHVTFQLFMLVEFLPGSVRKSKSKFSHDFSYGLLKK